MACVKNYQPISLSLYRIPGRLNDRRTPLGELNWIFTAITDTIAWNTIQRGLFQKLFRQDLLVASLFRNFLLAERVMRSYNCTPESHPPLPPTSHHPMWQAWDLALDHIMAQLPALIENKVNYEPCQFFAQQLSAFQVWLINGSEFKSPPEQLPIVLQFLLSQAHRLQALELLGRFLDLGAWAVNSALSVGIFPYVLKLLGSKLRELQPILVFIWAKILAVDPSCQNDLVKDGGYKYFIQILSDHTMQFEYRTMAAFVLAVIVDNYPKGQEVCLQSNVIALCLSQLEEPNPLLKQWLAICLGRLWKNFDAARWCGVRDSAHEKLYSLLWHEQPDVRAAAVFALGTYIMNVPEDGQSDLSISIDHNVGMRLLTLLNDGSPIVRREVVCALHGLVCLYEKQFQIAALRSSESERMGASNLSTSLTPTGWIHVSIDPPEVETSFEASNSGTTSSIVMGRSITSNKTPLRSLTNGMARSESPPSLSDSSVGSGGSEERFLDSSLPRRSSMTQSFGPPQLTPSSSVAAKNVYNHVWKGLVFLASDPYTKVNQPAQFVVHSLHDKLRQKSLARSIGVTLATNSVSVPSSPSKDSKAATLGPSSIRIMSRPTLLHPSSSTQEFRGRTPLSLPRGASSAAVSLPATSRHTLQRHIQNTNNAKKDDEDDSSEEGGEDLSPMETGFCNWCCKYFANSLMKQPEECDPNNPSYQQREYRFIRNHLVREEAERLCSSHQARNKLSDQIFVNKENKTPQLIKFHPYVSQLAVMHKNSWSVWDVEEGSRLVTEHYNSQARITAAEFINPHDITFLLTGSDDGAVHVWRDYATGSPSLVTAWRALTDMLPASRNAGMVLEWEQATGLLYAGGDVRHIRVWDTHKEVNIQDIPTGADSCVTCLTSDSADRSLLIAGCGDGTIRLYDRRQPPNQSLVQTLKEHTSWVVNVFMQIHNQTRDIVSCSVAGDVRIWDPRFMKSVRSISASSSSVNACEIHPRSPLLACASPQHAIKVFNLETDEMLNHIRYHDGFMGQRIGPTKSLAFHPYKVWLAAGGTDGLIAIYSTERNK